MKKCDSVAKGKCRAMLGHDSKFMSTKKKKKKGLLILVAVGAEPALPGLPEDNPVLLKSNLKAEELICLLLGNKRWGRQAFFKCPGQDSCRANRARCTGGFVGWDQHFA